MKSKYIQKIKNLNENFDLNLTLFTLPKHKRIMHKEENGLKSFSYVNIPDLLFILTTVYNKNTKKHVYGGEPRDALHVCCSDNNIDLDNLYNNVFYKVKGYQYTICTNHKYDNKRFSSIEEMINFLIDELLSYKIYYDEFKLNIEFNLKNFINRKGFFDSYEEFKNFKNFGTDKYYPTEEKYILEWKRLENSNTSYYNLYEC